MLRDLSWLSFSLYFSLLTRKKIKGGKGEGQSLPEEPRGGQTARRDSGEITQTETEAPERSQSRIASSLNVKEDGRKERARASQRSPEQTEEGDTQTVAPERPQSRISSLLRVKEDRERKEGARASQRSPEKARRQGETQGKSRRRSPKAG